MAEVQLPVRAVAFDIGGVLEVPADRHLDVGLAVRSGTGTVAGNTGTPTATLGGEGPGRSPAAGTMTVIPVARPAGVRRWPGGLAWALWLLVLLGVAATAWLDRLLRQAGLAQEAWLVPANSPELVAAVTAATVGAVLASRRPRHPVGWLLLGLGLSFCLASVTSSYGRYGLAARPGALPGAAWLVGVQAAGVLAEPALVGFVLLLTPTGTLPSPRWRWWARFVAAAAATGVLAGMTSPRPLYPEHPTVGNPLAVPALSALFLPSALVVLVGVVVGAGSLVGRYRRARGTERLQLRWLALAAAVSTAALVVAILPIPLLGDGATWFAVGFGVSLAVLPLATGASILRYRLYDLDRIISRTVAYGLLTMLLALGYTAVVLGLGRLLHDSSSLAVAGATRWPSRPRCSRPAAVSSRPSTGASTVAATTPARPSPRSAPGCASRSS
jgi:hypothetical protein